MPVVPEKVWTVDELHELPDDPSQLRESVDVVDAVIAWHPRGAPEPPRTDLAESFARVPRPLSGTE